MRFIIRILSGFSARYVCFGTIFFLTGGYIVLSVWPYCTANKGNENFCLAMIIVGIPGVFISLKEAFYENK